jgi:hypothetical protein
MNDRDVEAGPGDDRQLELGDELFAQPDEEKQIVLPKKADVSRSDQARRLRPSRTSATRGEPAGEPAAKLQAAPLMRSTGSGTRPLAQAHPIADPEQDELRHEVEEPTATPIHLGAPHPLARARRESPGRGLGRPLGLGGPGRGRSGAAKRVDPWAGRGSRFGRPSMRGMFGFAGLTATVAVVTALIVTLPSQPSSPAPTGSVYGVTWHSAGRPPVARLDFGPYFTTLDQDLLMLGTVSSVTNNVVSSTTSVWSTSDGSTWTQKSVAGSFDIDGRRFVAQGLSDDGQGGLVAVGNSIGSSPTDVVASAWHSRDGTSWTPMEVEAAKGQEMVAGTVSRSGTVVAAGNGVAWLSTDGRKWSAQVLPGASTAAGSYTPRAVGTWSGGFVIIGLWTGTGPTRSAAWFSATGRDWVQAKTSLDGFDTHGISTVDGAIVAVGSDLSDTAPGLAASWSSLDGITWTKTTAPADRPNVAMDGVASVEGALVAFGAPPPSTASAAVTAGPTLPGSTPVPADAEILWVSESGFDWLPIPSTGAPLTHAHVVTVGSRVLMIGGAIGGSIGGLAALSGDLVLGPARPPASQSAPPANYALSLQTGNSPMIADVNKDFTLGPITTSKDRFLVFATGPTGTSIFSSPDGSLWSRETDSTGLTPKGGVTGRPVILQAVPDGQGGIVAVGKVTNSSGDNGMIWHMTQSGTWKQAQFQDDTPPEFSSITPGPSGFVVSSDEAGGSQIMYSTDNGDTWQASSITVGDGFALTVATYRYGYVAVGTDPARNGATTAWTSPDGRTWTIRTDWHLPPKVTALFGIGNSLVAAAATAPPVVPGSSALPSGSAGTASAAPSSSASASAKASPKATAKPAATPVPAPTTTTWWWSVTGLVWQQSGLVTSGGNLAILDKQILVFDAPIGSANWTAWTSADGHNWRKPASDPVDFPGARTSGIASLGSRVVIVGWEGPGALKDYMGTFSGQ